MTPLVLDPDPVRLPARQDRGHFRFLGRIYSKFTSGSGRPDSCGISGRTTDAEWRNDRPPVLARGGGRWCEPRACTPVSARSSRNPIRKEIRCSTVSLSAWRSKAVKLSNRAEDLCPRDGPKDMMRT